MRCGCREERGAEPFGFILVGWDTIEGFALRGGHMEVHLHMVDGEN